MRVYLDSNVIIDVCDGRAPGFAEVLFRADEAEICSFPFTAEHVDEITFGGNDARNDMRLNFLSRLSHDQYFIHSLYEFGFRTESPSSVYATLNEVVVAPCVERDLANMVSFEDQRRARASLGLESRELNNLSPMDAIGCIERALASYEITPAANGVGPRSLADFLAHGEENTSVHFAELWSQMGADPKHMLLDKKIVSLFSLFDCFGFWPDSRVMYEKGSRLADSRHAFNASHCALLVSTDKRFRNKSAAVYEYLQIPVLVQSVDQFERALCQKLE